MRVDGVGRYALLGETLDDAAGEAFDKTAQLLGLGYPGGPALSRGSRDRGDPTRFKLPRPMLASGDLDFSFSGLKTAVLNLRARRVRSDDATRADIAAAFQAAIVDVLAAKCRAALDATGLAVWSSPAASAPTRQLRERARCDAAARKASSVFYPEPELCTDNGAMIAFSAALRLRAGVARPSDHGFAVRPRWDLAGV